METQTREARTKNTMTSNIYLTGFMGCGKSHTGHRLADLLGLPFLDLDAAVETAAGKTINAIFADDGEAAFRDLETEALHATRHGPVSVIATGGGAPCFNDNMTWMNARGKTVFLDPPPAVLLARLEAGRAHRPLLQTGAELSTFVARKLASRRPFYEKAQIQLVLANPKADAARLLSDLLR